MLFVESAPRATQVNLLRRLLLCWSLAASELNFPAEAQQGGDGVQGQREATSAAHRNTVRKGGVAPRRSDGGAGAGAWGGEGEEDN